MERVQQEVKCREAAEAEMAQVRKTMMKIFPNLEDVGGGFWQISGNEKYIL